MLFSYNWLKKYVPDLPMAEDLEKGIIFHSFEVESLEKKNNDWLLEVKVLPDRAHDCLSHLGLAREVATIFNLKVKEPVALAQASADLSGESSNLADLKIDIEESALCRRYVGRRVESITIGPSPTWLVEALEAVGQRSINNIVDATNYVLFDLGQPLHAFDADKVQGKIIVRRAKIGEKMITLDQRDLVLDDSVLIIADEAGPLALAGVKGGNRAEIGATTKNIILESASFDPVNIRRTSNKFNLRTDASKRFENELASETALMAMNQLSTIISETAGGHFGQLVDNYTTRPSVTEIIIEPKVVSAKLGIEVPVVDIKNILERLGLGVEEEGNKFKLIIPYWRLDLQEEANIIEEVGRIYGYDKIAPKLISGTEVLADRPGESSVSLVEKSFALKNKVREILATAGFTEVMSYALTDRGEIELANPLASDKAFLRTNLSDWLTEKLKFNLDHVLFDDEPVKIFEIGKVFKTGEQEQTNLAIGIAYRKKIKGQDAKEELKKVFVKLETLSKGSPWTTLKESSMVNLESDTLAVSEINLDQVITEIEEIPQVNLANYLSPAFNYQPVSLYPRIIRDIAVWVPAASDIKTIAELVKSSAGALCVEGPILFDDFEKEGRRSLAFRLVFQSYIKTLSDDEANAEMVKVIEVLEKQSGFEVRK